MVTTLNSLKNYHIHQQPDNKPYPPGELKKQQEENKLRRK
jgi:hypothetical protein